MILVAVAVNFYVTWTKSVLSFSIVGIWALFAIYVRHQATYKTIALVALSGLLVLSASILIHFVRSRMVLAT